MPLNDNDLLLINDSQDGNEAKKIKYGTLKENINGDSGNDLQAVTDNGNTTTNSATFTTEINVNSTGDSAYRWQESGANVYSLFNNSTSDNLTLFNNTDNKNLVEFYQTGQTVFNVDKIKLNADGSASFSGVVGSTGAFGNLATAEGAYFYYNDTEEEVRVASSGPNGTNRPIVFTQFQSGKTEVERMRIDDSGDVKIGGTLPASPNISLNAGGSASLSSNVTIGDYAGGSADKNGFYFDTNNITQFIQYETGAESNASVFSVVEGQSVSTPKLALRRDGSASFAGDVISGPLNTGSNSGKGVGIYGASGAVYAQRESTQGSLAVWTGWLGSVATSSINAAGSASFAGNVNGNSHFKSDRVSSGLENFIGQLNGTTTSAIFADGSAHFAGNVTSDGTIGFNLEADNPANYTTTTVDGEEVQVYNGPVLDVKERVLNLVARLDALEANEVIDDAVDTSLLSLLASASARLDSIEARLAALEGGN